MRHKPTSFITQLKHIFSAEVSKHVSHAMLLVLLYVIFISFLANYLLLQRGSVVALIGVYCMPLLFAYWGHVAGKMLLRSPLDRKSGARPAAANTTSAAPISLHPYNEDVVYDLHALLKQSLAPLHLQAQAKGLQLSLELHENVPQWIVGDQSDLELVLHTLLDNAVKHTPHGEVNLNIKCLEQAQGSVLLRIEILDTGIGISPEQQATLFSVGRADQAKSDCLATCQPLVEALGGRLGVSSKPQQGSAFWFTAILRKQHSPELAA